MRLFAMLIFASVMWANDRTGTPEPHVTPEPATWALMAVGLGSLAAWKRFKK